MHFCLGAVVAVNEYYFLFQKWRSIIVCVFFFFFRFYGRKSRRIQVWRSQYINSKFWETHISNDHQQIGTIRWAQGKTSAFLTIANVSSWHCLLLRRLQAGKRLAYVAGVWTEIRLARLRWTREERGKGTLVRASCSHLPYNAPFTSFLQACQAY